jgi:(R,R)-butanediol dehydrogenase/meso-butanediol dehydrogenase/diacetyl reductase/L-idonate 5-dehydrogenase
MRACVLHAAGDLRVEDRPEDILAPDAVRLSFAHGGICGSDLHYLAEGRVGESIVIDPMVLGHEFTGTVLEVGSAVTDLLPGTLVAVNPARPCGTCAYCRSGQINLCRAMRYMGSAARRPHEQGGFLERPVVSRRQCVPLPEGADPRLAALAEPYSIALHAVSRGGDLVGKRVLITGAGTIGALCAVAARRAGAAHVTVTDVAMPPLERVLSLGADQVVNVAEDAEGREALVAAQDRDVVLECSGAAAAIELAVGAARPAGRLVQVGFLPADRGMALNAILTKELELVGSYRFVDEFDQAVADIVSGAVDLSGVITGDFAVTDIAQAFATAADRQRSLKVMVHF